MFFGRVPNVAVRKVTFGMFRLLDAVSKNSPFLALLRFWQPSESGSCGRPKFGFFDFLCQINGFFLVLIEKLFLSLKSEINILPKT